jgi:hypothetical protein
MEIAVPKDDDLLSLTQQVRLRIVNTMTADPVISTDPKDIKALASVLKDIDAQVLTKQRLQQDNQNAKDDRETALQMAKMSEHLARTVGGNPFKRENAGRLNKDDGSLPEIDPVPGQMDVGPSNTRFRDFMQEHGVAEQ